MVIKVAIRIADDLSWKICEAIEYQGALWLVTRWLENRDLGIAKPERIIQLAGLDLRRSPVPSADWVLSTPIPKICFQLESDQLTPAPFFSIPHPDITVQLPSEGSTRH